MKNLMKSYFPKSIVFLLIFLFTYIVGCTHNIEPIEAIQLFKTLNQPGIPTTAGLASSEADPFPNIVWEYSVSDKMFFGIRLNKQLKEDITFTKYTIFNKGTNTETVVSLPDQLGPFKPGQVQLIALENPWPLPSEPGQYELRVY